MLILASGHDFQFMRETPEVPHDLQFQIRAPQRGILIPGVGRLYHQLQDFEQPSFNAFAQCEATRTRELIELRNYPE